jgi:hypothetical protein
MPGKSIVRNLVLSFFTELGAGIPKAVRLLFCFGKEAQIYIIASELVKEKLLTRVTRGIYMLPTQDGSMPSDDAIALAKAEGFGKVIYELDDGIRHAARNLKIMSGNPIAMYATSGASSSFKYRNGTIVFYKMANRKIELMKRKIGSTLNNFWKLFTHSKAEMDEQIELAGITENDKSLLPRILELLPMWLKTDLRANYEEFPWRLSLKEAIQSRAPDSTKSCV